MSKGLPIGFDTDGVTVWIHVGPDTIARFGRRGIDIHAPGRDVLAGKPTCLFCTHEETTAEDWGTFCRKVAEIHGVIVPWEVAPIRFRREAKIQQRSLQRVSQTPEA